MSSAGKPNNEGGAASASGSGPSPGKGGKFLELMQKRIMAEQQQQQQAPPNVDPNSQGQQQNQAISQQATSGPFVRQPPPQNSVAPAGAVDSSASKQQPVSRPKGKDFAAMSSRGPVPNIIAQPQPQLPPPQLPPQVQQQQVSSAGPIAGKPKGKDFSAMASRMAVPVQVPATATAQHHSQQMSQNPSSNDQAAQVARAAQMQAEARAAAGLPPLTKPTATSVSTTTPGLPSPRVNIQQQHHNQPQQYPGMGNIQQPQQHQSQQQQQQQQPIQQQSQSRSTSQGYGGPGQQQSQQLQTQYSSQTTPIYGNGGVSTHDASGRLMSNSSNNSVSTSGMQRNSRPTPVVTSQPQPNHRSSKTATTNTSKPREPPGRSPQPTNVEAKLTMQSSAVISSTVQPYMAPLVGQRIQDLVSSLDPSYTIDSQAQDQVLQLADDFLDKVCKQSLRLAAHRGSSVLEVQDVQLVLAKQWGIVIPGLGPPLLNKSRVVPPSTKGNLLNNSSNHSTSGTKRKSSGSSKSSSGIAHSEKPLSQSSKESKQNE